MSETTEAIVKVNALDWKLPDDAVTETEISHGEKLAENLISPRNSSDGDERVVNVAPELPDNVEEDFLTDDSNEYLDMLRELEESAPENSTETPKTTAVVERIAFRIIAKAAGLPDESPIPKLEPIDNSVPLSQEQIDLATRLKQEGDALKAQFRAENKHSKGYFEKNMSDLQGVVTDTREILERSAKSADHYRFKEDVQKHLNTIAKRFSGGEFDQIRDAILDPNNEEGRRLALEKWTEIKSQLGEGEDQVFCDRLLNQKDRFLPYDRGDIRKAVGQIFSGEDKDLVAQALEGDLLSLERAEELINNIGENEDARILKEILALRKQEKDDEMQAQVKGMTDHVKGMLAKIPEDLPEQAKQKIQAAAEDFEEIVKEILPKLTKGGKLVATGALIVLVVAFVGVNFMLAQVLGGGGGGH